MKATGISRCRGSSSKQEIVLRDDETSCRKTSRSLIENLNFGFFRISTFGFRIWIRGTHQLTIHQLHDLLVKKEVTSREATEALYRRIRETDGKDQSLSFIDGRRGLLRQADQVDRKIAKGKRLETCAGSLSA